MRSRKRYQRKSGARTNPVISEAREMAEKFHGRKVSREIEFDEEYRTPTNYAVIGELEEFVIVPLSDSKHEYPISFTENWDRESDVVQVCCDKEGKQIYFESGDQKLDKSLIDQIEGTLNKNQRFQILGYCRFITYCTDKHHLDEDANEKIYRVWYVESDGVRELVKDRCNLAQAEKEIEKIGDGCFWNCSYQHEFGEDGGEWPIIAYDSLNEHLILIGGTYEVRDVGIYN